MALYIPKRKYNIRAASIIILGDSLVDKYLLPFQLSLMFFRLNFGVLTNSLLFPICPSNTAMELCRENPSATEKKVKKIPI